MAGAGTGTSPLAMARAGPRHPRGALRHRSTGRVGSAGTGVGGMGSVSALLHLPLSLPTGSSRTTGAVTSRSGARSRTGPTRPASPLRRPITGRRLIHGRPLPVRPGRHGVGYGSGAGAGPVRTGPATDAVGVGSEAGIGRRLATHSAKLPFYGSQVSPAPLFSVARTICSMDVNAAPRT